MDDKQADSYMLADIEGKAFEQGRECGRHEMMEEFEELLMRHKLCSRDTSHIMTDLLGDRLEETCMGKLWDNFCKLQSKTEVK